MLNKSAHSVLKQTVIVVQMELLMVVLHVILNFTYLKVHVVAHVLKSVNSQIIHNLHFSLEEFAVNVIFLPLLIV